MNNLSQVINFCELKASKNLTRSLKLSKNFPSDTFYYPTTKKGMTLYERRSKQARPIRRR
jgi:hypothetical protein